MKDLDKNKRRFKARVLDWARKLDARVLTVAVRPMRKKWASFSTAGRLTFDIDLLKLRQGLQDYVIVHELLHVHVPNHGKLWKSLMRAHLGDYEIQEAELQRFADTASKKGR
ncbi:MAG: M48 family metallopeptidase [Candidatus Hydrogenedentes bacterium]|nr:M48 family metallopeptidase [Candidatus Hydrogenedentota bacterium]